jgi:tryptophanyl-tRNA synthetase
MSASNETSAIFLKDQANQIKNKVNKYAFSGGQVSEAEHRELGGDPDKDVAFQYLTFFLEDDEELERIRVAYRKGEMLTGELKARCIAELQVYVADFQERRAKVDEAVVDSFMAIRPLEWGANPNPTRAENTGGSATEGAVAETNADGTAKLTKNQEKKLAKEKLIAEKKAAKDAEKAAKAAAA